MFIHNKILKKHKNKITTNIYHKMINYMKNKAYIALFISVLSVSFAAIFIVTISDFVHPLTISFYRLFFTAVLLLPFVFLHKKTRQDLFNISKKNLIIIAGIGIILALHFAFWVTSLDYTSVASSVLLVTAHPVLVAPVAHFLFKEHLSFSNIFGIVISLFGVAILVAGNYGLGPMTLEGNILAILGGIAAGLYILGGRRIRKNISIGAYAFLVYFIAAIILFFLCLIFSADLINLPKRDYFIIFIMAIISGIFGHTFYNWSLKYIRASTASVALLGEPLGSSILAIIIPWIQQIPSNFTIFGGAIILFGIYFTARTKKNQ